MKFNISNPDFKTRIELINIYTKNKILEENIDKEKLAKLFENLSCAAIESILNEASMLAIMQDKEKISIDDIMNALKKIN